MSAPRNQKQNTTRASYPKLRSFLNTYLLGRKGIFMVFLIFILIHLIGFAAPDCLMILDVGPAQAKAIASTLISSYISVLGIGLAISAIILAIVQIANRQISITHLVFSRSYFIPLVYFGLLNIIFLGILQLLYKTEEGLFFREAFIQFVIISIYSFAIFIVLTFLVFYKTFRYLNFLYVVDDFLKDIYIEIVLNSNNDYLSMRGREVFGEIAEAVSREDNVLLDRFLQAVTTIFRMNPNSTFLFGVERKMASWHIDVIKSGSISIHSTLLSAWRELRTYAVNSEGKAISNYFSAVPALTLSEIEENNRSQATFAYALRLKEMIVYSSYNDENEIQTELKSYLYLNDVVIMIMEMLQKKDYESLEEIYLQIEQMVTMLSSDIAEVRNPYRQQAPTEKEIKRATLQSQLRNRIFYAVLSVFSYHIYKTYYYSKERLDSRIFELLTSVLYHHSTDYSLTELSEINIPDVVNWREWVWMMEKRNDGQVYSVVDGQLVLDFGILHLYLKYPYIRPTQADHLMQTMLDNLAADTQHLQRTIPGISAEVMQENIARVKDQFNGLNQDEQAARITALIQAPQSPKRIEAFKKDMTSQWLKSRSLYPIFKYYKAVEENPQDQLKQVGTPRMNLKEGRMMFVEKPEASSIYGIEWGNQVNREVERFFANSLSRLTPTIVPTITDALDQVIEGMDENDNTGWVAILPIRAEHKWQVDLVNSGRYRSFDQIETPFPFRALGIYDGKIPVVRIVSSISDQTAIIIKLPTAIKYRIRTSDDYQEKQLQIDIRLHEDNQGPAENPVVPGQGNIPAENAVVIVQEIMDFEILNKDQIKIYHIEP